MTGASITAVMVTYNSEVVAHRAVKALLTGTQAPASIVIVDNASGDTRYLDDLARTSSLVTLVKLSQNTGFCAGNNRAMAHVGKSDHVLLLNPDAFVSHTFIERSSALLERDASVGAVGPKLLAAEPETGSPTGRIDSAGIFQTHLGRFYDRGQAEVDHDQYAERDLDVTALCAAAVLLRREAIDDITRDGPLLDPRFVMYKEDIDLSFRLRRAGWRTVYDGSLEVLHCRGWNPDRQAMPAWARRRSVINEWRLWTKGWTPERGRVAALPYLVAKSVVVAAGR